MAPTEASARRPSDALDDSVPEKYDDGTRPVTRVDVPAERCGDFTVAATPEYCREAQRGAAQADDG
jgi:hypothetical protein